MSLGRRHRPDRDEDGAAGRIGEPQLAAMGSHGQARQPEAHTSSGVVSRCVHFARDDAHAAPLLHRSLAQRQDCRERRAEHVLVRWQRDPAKPSGRRASCQGLRAPAQRCSAGRGVRRRESTRKQEAAGSLYARLSDESKAKTTKRGNCNTATEKQRGRGLGCAGVARATSV